MPTRKRRVGFIPRIIVLEIINKLSFENNLSNSKIINILVEEALSKRGILDIKNGTVNNDFSFNFLNEEKESIIKNKSNFHNNESDDRFLGNKDSLSNDIKDDLVDSEVYEKFLMFLQFREKIKNDGIK